MTKKDYVLITKVLRGIVPCQTKTNIVTGLVVAFKRDNPQFEPGRFEVACIYGAENNDNVRKCKECLRVLSMHETDLCRECKRENKLAKL